MAGKQVSTFLPLRCFLYDVQTDINSWSWKLAIAKLQCRWFFHSHSRCRSYEWRCELQRDVYVISEAFTCCSDTSLRQELSKAVFYLASPGRQQQGLKLLCLIPFRAVRVVAPKRERRSRPTVLTNSDSQVVLCSKAARQPWSWPVYHYLHSRLVKADSKPRIVTKTLRSCFIVAHGDPARCQQKWICLKAKVRAALLEVRGDYQEEAKSPLKLLEWLASLP